MEPIVLPCERLVLTAPTPDDADRVTEYCQDPLFERYLSTPWPYRRTDAEYFLGESVPSGWQLGKDLVWALRTTDDGPLLGVVGLHRRRATDPTSLDLGYWLGRPHRGNGYMSEAARTAVGWAFSALALDTVYWECAIGNIGSARVALHAGFRYTGIGPARVATREGTHPPHWNGRRDRTGRAVDGRDDDDTAHELPWPDGVERTPPRPGSAPHHDGRHEPRHEHEHDPREEHTL